MTKSSSTNTSLTPSIHANQADGDDAEGSGFKRLGPDDALEPGTYWRCKQELLSESHERWTAPEDKLRYGTVLRLGDVHLLMEVHEFDGSAHSVSLLNHPREGSRAGTFDITLEDFFACMEPCHDAEAVREKELQEIMGEVAGIQSEIALISANPMASEAVRDKAEKAIKELDEKLEKEAMMQASQQKSRENDLAKIHRRAARRSAAAGNPIAVKSMVVSDSLSEMIDKGVTSDSLAELQYETRRRAVIADAASKYIMSCTEALGRTMTKMAPYYAEKAQVGIAKSAKAIERAKAIHQGLESLRLYTGDGTNVIELRSGASALPKEPLTIFQGKRFMNEELCLYQDVDLSFDYEDEDRFFQELKTNERLMNQVLPSPRCVVSMAVTRQAWVSGYEKRPFEQLESALQRNKSVFLLVRNGENLHVVYSGEPSHESARRLFPSATDLSKPFMGLDGTKLRLEDVRMVKATEGFDEMALHYKRFLILLCGLDHRLKLFGDFYPQEDGLKFMSEDFQSRYFHFVADDDETLLLGSKQLNVADWFSQKNLPATPGSRVVCHVSLMLYSTAGFIRRRHSMVPCKINGSDMMLATVRRSGEDLYVQVPAREKGRPENDETAVTQFKAWLTGPESKGNSRTWLCMDTVTPDEITSYLSSRSAREGLGINNIQTLLMARQALLEDEVAQAELRAHIKRSALDAKVLSGEGLDNKILLAINTWRASNGGVAAPSVHDKEGVEQVMNLLYPKSLLEEPLRATVEALCDAAGRKPLSLVRTGKDQLVCYTTSTEAEMAVVGNAVEWGWCERIVLKTTGRGANKVFSFGSKKTVWRLKSKAVIGGEDQICDWSLNNQYLRDLVEPTKPEFVASFLEQVADWGRMSNVLCLCAVRSRTDTPEPMPALSEDELTFLEKLEMGYINACRERYADGKEGMPKMFIPLGVIQRGVDTKPEFVYAQTTGFGFFKTAYDKTQFDKFMLKLFHVYGISRKNLPNSVSQHMQATVPWRFLLTVKRETPVKWTFAYELTMEVIKECAWSTNLVGGRKRDEVRWHLRNGEKVSSGPKLKTVKAFLSPNRVFQRILKQWRMDRRRFYESLPNRLRDVRFNARDSDVKEACLKERLLKFSPTTPHKHAFGPLVIDSSTGKVVAGKYLGSKRRPAE